VLLPVPRAVPGGAAVNGRWRLFTKNTALCEHVSGGIRSDACPVLEGQGEGCEPRTEAPVNGGRNYNGPKVAKFLVG
jgi:hypothetical protein